MDTRLILQITLGLIGALILVVGGLLILELTRDAETQVIERVVEREQDTKEKENPWASEDNREAAISLVKRKKVAESDTEEDDEPTRISEMLDDEKFIEDKLKITSGEAAGWEAFWWGETKYGPQFYLVRYAFEDANIRVGPAWLVDLKEQKVVPKNVLATVAENPQDGVKSDYYDKAEQVVAAITNHRFESGVNLGGALLLYFSQRTGDTDDDTILGWTIDHDRGNKFDAYFQWVEEGEPTYAEFKFDYDRKALRAVNLQAADIMRAGEEFEQTEQVDIMPRSYDPDQKRWLGPAAKQCAQPRHRSRCKALASVLKESELVESLEWLLTAQANTPKDFERCKKRRNCRFMPERRDDDNYRILYVFNLEKEDEFNHKDPDIKWACEHSLKADKEREKDKAWGENGQCVAWDVNSKTGEITPVGETSTVAYRAVRPRS
ncbi:MAG: hypothetical protein ACLFVJ_02000 [Persicimonas sp.]